jgi:membrane-bound serine protease (ClpP class)
MKIGRLLLWCSLCLVALFLANARSPEVHADQEKQERSLVYLLEVDGSINPALADYILKGIDKAVHDRATCMIIRMDTPGGLVSTTKTIIKEMMNARVPIVVYVAPRGSSAASAGALITVAADVAAMAPSTNIGAAHPVGGGGEDIGGAMSEKVINDLSAYMRGIVEKKGRNVAWVNQAIRESVSVTAKEALELKVIDVVADSVEELLGTLNGRTLEKNGQTHTFKTEGARVEKIPHGWRFKILDVVANPNIAYVLMMIGSIGIIAEIYSPGAIFPGVAGGICMLLSLFAMQVLPVNYVGVLLLILSLIFFILELKMVSHGLLAIGGVISLTLGSIMLFESDDTTMRVSWSVIIPTVATVSAFFIVAMTLVAKAWLSPARTGDKGLVGEVGTALTDLNLEGRVAIHGEYWNARADSHIPSGERVRVVRVDSLTLTVTRDLGS